MLRWIFSIIILFSSMGMHGSDVYGHIKIVKELKISLDSRMPSEFVIKIEDDFFIVSRLLQLLGKVDSDDLESNYDIRHIGAVICSDITYKSEKLFDGLKIYDAPNSRWIR